MIILLGIPSEPPVAMLADSLERAGHDFTMVNQREALEHRLDVTIRDGRPQGHLVLGSRRIDIETVSAVYVRLSDHRVLPEREGLEDDDPRARHIDRLHQQWIRLLDALPGLVVNRLGSMSSNSSKTYQTELINAAGVASPPTLVTTDPGAARRFIEHHRGSGGVIFKSVSGVRSIVRRVTDEDLERLDLLVRCPTQFQAFVPGDDVRVHVVGDEVIATRIVSDADDYRYARLEKSDASLEPTELSSELAQRCRDLAGRLDLHFAGIDLRMDGDRAVCFEVNPSPAYSYYEANTGQPISDALARLLAEARVARELAVS